MVGCSGNKKWSSFEWNINGSGYCSNFTAYGNENSLNISSKQKNHLLYYCSSRNSTTNITSDPVLMPVVNKPLSTCASDWLQSFGQYAKLFYDVKDDTDWINGLVNDSDDEDLGKWPIAIAYSTGVQELYLISQDGRNRLFFRRKLKEEKDVDGISGIGTGEQLYVLQMLRLRWFDAGTKHNFSLTNGNDNPGLYDGQIDTWACDYAQGFIGNWGDTIGGGFSDYKLPVDADDCRVDVPQGAISMDARNLTLSPDTDPTLAWKQNEYQINPHIKVFLLNRVYLPMRQEKLPAYKQQFQFVLQTAFNTKTLYSQ